MAKIVECVPNFSEGKDLAKINAIVEAAKCVPGVVVLDVEKDADHNRTVLTFIAPVDTAVEAMFRVVRKSSELIDLNVHKGEHPRMGATDVAPFIPLMGSTAEECVELARRLGERVGKELNIPVYLYDMAAQKPERRNLANVRKGQFEGLKNEIGVNPEKTPDFGPNKIHPTFGAIAVGAREQIVNFNVNLETTDMVFGKELAKKIRTSGGGLPELRAKEIFLESKSQVQISTVLTNFRVTSLADVMAAVQKETGPKGIKIVNTELIGLTTQEALFDYALKGLGVQGFNPHELVLENKIAAVMGTWQAGAGRVLDALAEPTPTPGGGSAGAIASSMGCALGAMACAVSLRSKKLDEAKRPALERALAELSELRAQVQNCAAEDSHSYDLFVEAKSLPKEDPERARRMQAALNYAAEVPLKTAQLSAAARKTLVAIEKDVIKSVGSDFKSAGYLLEAGFHCAVENVRINLPGLADREEASRLERELGLLLEGQPVA